MATREAEKKEFKGLQGMLLSGALQSQTVCTATDSWPVTLRSANVSDSFPREAIYYSASTVNG